MDQFLSTLPAGSYWESDGGSPPRFILRGGKCEFEQGDFHCALVNGHSGDHLAVMDQ